MTRKTKRYPLKKLFYRVFGLLIKASYYLAALPFTWNAKTFELFIPTKWAVYKFQCFTFYIGVLLILKAFFLGHFSSFAWIMGLFVSLTWKHAAATINVVIAHFIKLHGELKLYI